MPEDFWPKEIGEAKKIAVPASIAAEQAALLGQKTKNVVTARVVSKTSTEEGQVKFGFDLVAPALSNYRLRLFNFAYRLDRLYPVVVYSLGFRGLKEPIEAADEAAWKELLKRIFSHESVIGIIQALQSQSEDLGTPDEDFRF